MNIKTIHDIIKKYDIPDIVVSTADGDGGLDQMWSRFEQASISQAEDGYKVVSEYAVWANTVRDNIIVAIAKMDEDQTHEAKKLLIQAVNSLSAFSDFQHEFKNTRNRCQNPECGRIFEPSKYNSKQKYCNRAACKRYRDALRQQKCYYKKADEENSNQNH